MSFFLTRGIASSISTRSPVQGNQVKMVTAKSQSLSSKVLNLMGYDALGIGDDDLTLGKDFLIELSKKAKFPFLSSNLVDSESEKPVFQSHFIKEVNGIRVGIFSLISPDAFSGPQDPRLKGLAIQNPVETAQRIDKELKAEYGPRHSLEPSQLIPRTWRWPRP